MAFIQNTASDTIIGIIAQVLTLLNFANRLAPNNMYTMLNFNSIYISCVVVYVI